MLNQKIFFLYCFLFVSSLCSMVSEFSPKQLDTILDHFVYNQVPDAVLKQEIKYVDSNGRTLEFYAIFHNNFEKLQLLYFAGASFTKKIFDTTPYQYAVQNKKREAVLFFEWKKWFENWLAEHSKQCSSDDGFVRSGFLIEEQPCDFEKKIIDTELLALYEMVHADYSDYYRPLVFSSGIQKKIGKKSPVSLLDRLFNTLKCRPIICIANCGNKILALCSCSRLVSIIKICFRCKK